MIRYSNTIQGVAYPIRPYCHPTWALFIVVREGWEGSASDAPTGATPRCNGTTALPTTAGTFFTVRTARCVQESGGEDILTKAHPDRATRLSTAKG